MMLGYIPDRAYYFTVSTTVDLGVLVWSPINLCPPENRPAVPGAGRGVVPWEPSPPELALPAPRTDGAVVQVGTSSSTSADRTARRRRSTVYVAKTVGTGNFDPWADGPGAARAADRRRASRSSPAASTSWAASTPTARRPRRRYVLTPDGTTGELGTGRRRRTSARCCPRPAPAAAAIATADGLLLIGGANATGPVDDDLEVDCSTRTARSGSGRPRSRSRRPQTGATAGVVGDFVWLFGGRDANGPVGDRPAGRLRPGRRRGPARRTPTRARSSHWATNAAANLPGAARRRRRAGRPTARCTSSAAPTDRAARRGLLGPAVQRRATSPSGSTSTVSDLPTPADRRRAVVSGPNAIIVGGTTSDGRRRHELSGEHRPAAAVLPARPGRRDRARPDDQGEIGQQLGYLNAAGAGAVNFIILILIGWAYAHKADRHAPGRSARGPAPAADRPASSPSPGSGVPDRVGSPACGPRLHPARDVHDVPRPLRSRNPVTAADRPPVWQMTITAGRSGTSPTRAWNVDIGMCSAPGARTV